jgi:hypothetical protein
MGAGSRSAAGRSAARDRLRALPAAARGRRRTGTLRIEHVDAAVAGVAAHPEDAWSCDTGGAVAPAYK